MKKLFTVAIVANAVAILVSGMAAVKAASLTPLGTFGNTEPGWRMPDEVLPGDTPDTTDGSGFYAYLQPSNLERGLAYNPTTGNLILVSRSPLGNGIRILDGQTGVDIGSVNQGSGIISGGTFTTNMVGVAEDGAIYVSNLTTSTSGAGGNFKVYRWDNESATAPTVAYDGDPLNGARIGDSFDVIGSGVDTRLVAGYGTSAPTLSNSFTLLTTTNGLDFAHTNVSIPTNPPLNGDFRLGITFQDADTVIGRQLITPAHPYARIVDVAGSTGTLVSNFATEGGGLAPLDFAVVNGKPLLAVVNANNSRLHVYDLSPGYDEVDPNPAIAYAPLLPFSNVNGNGTGSVKFGAISGNTAIVYVMNTNNGIQAFTLTLDPGTLDGDYNGDGVVDAADYVLWRKSPGDFGGDPAGYDTWAANFGQTNPGSGSLQAGSAVPEPSGIACFLIVAAGLMLSRRNR